jgi:hypothetical protein
LKGAACALACTAIVAFAPAAWAASSSVAIAFSGCDALDPTEVRRILEIELLGQALAPDTILFARCGDADMTWVAAAPGLSTRRRLIDGRNVARETLARVFALGAAELARGLAEEAAGPPTRNSAPPLAAKPPVPTTTAIVQPSPAPAFVIAPVQLLFGIEARTASAGLAVGPAASVAYWPRRWGIELAGAGAATTQVFAAGSLESWNARLTGLVFAGARTRAWSWRAGVGASFGMVRFVGAAASPAVTDRSALTGFGGPCAALAGARALSDGIRVELRLEVGHHVVNAEALMDGDAVAELAGRWFGMRLGVSTP